MALAGAVFQQMQLWKGGTGGTIDYEVKPASRIMFASPRSRIEYLINNPISKIKNAKPSSRGKR
jgi:hypothetical protein